MKRNAEIVAIPPGVTIKEQLNERGMKQREFATRMGMSEKHISKLINGEVQLTMETARRLEMVLGVPARFWFNLEAIYREDIAKIEEEHSMNEDIEIALRMPYDQMVQIGWIVDVAKNTERVRLLRKYFELSELKYLQKQVIPRIACRKLSDMEKDDCVLLVWAQKAKLEARKVETKPIDIAKLRNTIPYIRMILTNKSDQADELIMQKLAECGVALVFLPRIEHGFLHGATFRDGNKIVLGMNAYEKNSKEFSLSLLHELAHIIYGHIEKVDGISEEDERLADEFAEKDFVQ